MNVHELIEQLKGMDPERPVWVMENVDEPWLLRPENVQETNLEGYDGKEFPVVLLIGW
jgi:hypothetical protein